MLKAIKISKSINTYTSNTPIMRKKITLEDIDQKIGVTSTTKANGKEISDTGATHDMNPNHGSFI